MKRFATASFATGLIIGSIFFSVIVSAWTAPTGAPPTLNASAPVNLSATAQSKTGSLGVGGLAVFGNASITGNLTLVNTTGNGVDATGPSSGSSFYGVIGRAGSYFGALGRADGFSFVGVGTLWNQGNMTINGAGNGITFPDGTVQTTAAGGVSAIGSLPTGGGSASIATAFSGVQILGEGYTTNNGQTLFSHHTQVYVANIGGTWSYVATIDGYPTSATLASGVQSCVGGTPTVCMTRTVGNALQLATSPGGSASGGGFIYQVFK